MNDISIMIIRTSKSLLFCVVGILSATIGEAILPIPPPLIPNASRIVLGNRDGMQQFTFRGGVVNYWPSQGSQWRAGPNSADGDTLAGASEAADLLNGCLVYACARAEQIRLHPMPGESQSRVIAYRRSDGSGHAFVYYKNGSTFTAEDNYGNTTAMPAFENRAASEALYMAKAFQKRTSAGRFPPASASFVGAY